MVFTCQGLVMKKAVVLLSGGLDSTTVLAIAQKAGFEINGLTFSYGQRHETEILAAKKVAEAYKIHKHIVLPIDLRLFGGSSLTSDTQVPKGRSESEMGIGIPSTYVPARNTIFLSYALAWSEVLGVGDIFIGVNALDYSGYPDCRPDFVNAFEKMANLATKLAVEGKVPVTIHAPLINLSKSEIIKKGITLGIDYSLTSTCYDPAKSGEACGGCDACFLRLKGFAENGIKDPGMYRKES